jgi:F420-dependent oxidoreductase-like protein
MRIGLHIGKFDWPGSPNNIGEMLSQIAKTADKAGLYSLWVMDHLFQLGSEFGIIHGPVETAMMEGYSSIAYMAAVTQRIKLGLLVTCPIFREPGLLVKIVSTIDVLSGGRVYLGIGAGWYEREAKGLGLHFPSLKERYERLEESLQIINKMWIGDVIPFNGKYYQLIEPLNIPQPLSQPHPPILIGGSGEKKTLRLVAEYGDACNLIIGTQLKGAGRLQESREEGLARLSKKLTILEQHCIDVGRAFDEIEKTVVTYIKLAPDAMKIDEVISLCRQLGDLGFEHIIFNMPNVHELEPLRVLGDDVIPKV